MCSCEASCGGATPKKQETDRQTSLHCYSARSARQLRATLPQAGPRLCPVPAASQRSTHAGTAQTCSGLTARSIRRYVPNGWTTNRRRRRIGRGGCKATMDELDISGMLDRRRERQRRISRDESAESRLARFIQLQTASFELLRSSPEGYREFHRRNHKSRRVEVVDGVWHPVSVDRRIPEA